MYPKSEKDIVALANNVKAGLTSHVDLYPDPPIPPATMTTTLASLQLLIEKAIEAKGQAEAAIEAKVAMLETLSAQLKKDLYYAELTVDGDDAKLKLLGWGGRKEPEPTSVPGQPRQLVVYPQGEGWLELQWMAPVEGGKVSTYNVRRRLKTESAWTLIVSSFERKVTIQNQPRGVELEYSVVATNKAGDSLMSNTVPVVL
jgi:hypothetical protein